MTSGQFHSTELSKVLKGDRQRNELNDIDVLADSIRRLGLIHPIVITRDNSLVAGERRLEACRQLGWTHIPAQYTDEIDQFTLKCIEFEENMKRKDLTWQEQCLAVQEYHSMQTEYDPKWSQEKTAAALGLNQSWVSRNLAVAEEAAKKPEILAIQRFSTARGIVERKEARKDEEALQELQKALRVPGTPTLELPASILNQDFTKWVETYSGPRFNFIHCDFPYGINADKMQQGGSVATHGGYEDEAETYFSLLNCLCSNLSRIATDSCHIMFWFSMYHYSTTIDYFHTHSDFILDPFPLVWLKSDNIGLLPDPQRGPRRIYETALFGSRGDRRIVSSVSNAYAAPTDRSIHMSAKPEPVLRHFFRMFCDASTLMLDPTCGSGNALRAAESVGASHVLGIEINKDFAAKAELQLNSARRLRNATRSIQTEVEQVKFKDAHGPFSDETADSR